MFKQAFLGDLQLNILTLMLPCLGVQASGSLIAQELVETNIWHQGSDANMSLSSASCEYYKMWVTVLVGAASQLLSAESKG